VLILDADFVPTIETLSAVQSAVEAYGYGSDGRQLKRAFVVPPFSMQKTFTTPLNFSFISENLGDDAEHGVNSFPEIAAHAADQRQYQCHANIDVQRWLEVSRYAVEQGVNSTAELYKVIVVIALDRTICSGRVRPMTLTSVTYLTCADPLQLWDGAVLRHSISRVQCSHVSRSFCAATRAQTVSPVVVQAQQQVRRAPSPLGRRQADACV
jgi:hypothetical protein